MAFLGARSSEEDRLKTLRGATTTSMGSSDKLIMPKSKKSDALLKEAALLGAAPTSTHTQWKEAYPSLYRKSLDDMEAGQGGVPACVIACIEGVLACGGESCVGLFRLQPSSEALAAVEERLVRFLGVLLEFSDVYL